MAFKFQLGEARMSGSLIQEGDFQLLDDDGTVRVTMARDNGSITGSAMTLQDGNLTNVGSIFCDVIEPDAAGVGLSLVFGGNTTTNKLSLTDNLADALNIEEGGASYMKFVTTNGSEQIVVGKNSTFSGTTIANLGTVSAATSITSTAFVGPIDGIVGGSTPAAGTFTNLVANGNVDLGDATTDTITATGQFDSDLVPSTDSARNLGTSAKRWSTIYVDSIVGADVNFDVESIAVGNTIAAGTDYALVTNGAGTVTLPAAAAGKRIYVKLGNASANVTIAAGAGDALPEVTGSLILESTGSAVTLVAIDATNWYIQ